MQHAIDALDGAAAGVQVGDAAADEAYLTSHRREVRPATGRQVVQHRDVVSGSDEVLHQVRADEARTPSDQITHVVSLGSARSLPLAGIRPARPGTCPATLFLCGAPPRLWRSRHRCLAPTSPGFFDPGVRAGRGADNTCRRAARHSAPPRVAARLVSL